MDMTFIWCNVSIIVQCSESKKKPTLSEENACVLPVFWQIWLMWVQQNLFWRENPGSFYYVSFKY